MLFGRRQAVRWQYGLLAPEALYKVPSYDTFDS